MRLRIDLGYDGAGFHGWASQPGLRTVQGDLEAALARVLRIDEVAVTCAGRTDTGVHARGQVVHVDVPDETAESALRDRLNGVLANDVRVLRVAAAAPGFDARFSAIWRRYGYRIADRPETEDPITRGHVLSCRRHLDVEAMNRAGEPLVGEHDFAAFCKRREGATTVRTLLDLSWARADTGRLLGTIRADAFCHHMVRSLVGALVSVGEGRRRPEWVGEVLFAGVRDPAVAVLPAHALTLEEVGYPADADLAEQAARARTVRALPVPRP